MSGPTMIKMSDTQAILHKFMRPPWGGGNQFLMALRDGLRTPQNGVRVIPEQFGFDGVTE